MSLSVKTCLVVSAAVIATATIARRAEAQFAALSEIRSERPPDSVSYVTASSANEDIAAVATRAKNAVPLARRDYPGDSIAQVVSNRARAWMARLQTMPSTVSELDAYAQVAMAAHEDVRAEQLFDTALGNPDLADADRARILLVAVQRFADPQEPKRLPMAERYLERLVAMGTAGWSITRHVMAEAALVRAYEALGRPADVARHGVALIRLLPHTPLQDLDNLNYADGDLYTLIVSAVAVQPGGRGTIKMLDSLLVASTVIRSDSMAIDSVAFITVQHRVADAWQRQMTQGRRIGEIAAPIYSNYWINTADSNAHRLRVDDGRIRVIESGNRGCAPCLQAMSGLAHLQEAFPGIQCVLVTFTQGGWANRVLSADEEKSYDKEFFVNQRQMHYPIALYLAPKKTDVDGSLVPDMNADSAQQDYPDGTGPLIYVLDGRGRIRYVHWTYMRGDEYRYLASEIRHLEAEAAANDANAGAPSPFPTSQHS